MPTMGKTVVGTDNEPLIEMPIDSLIRSISVNRNRAYSLFLGAGASITSGMPSAEQCVWEWKREIFVTNNPTLREQVGDISLSGSRKRIQKWLDQRGIYPPEGSRDEYSYYAQSCYATGNDRRRFFQNLIKTAKPFLGYRLFPLLAQEGLIRSIWTPNFDDLVAKACGTHGMSCIQIGLDSQSRTERPVASDELRIISLHGDYRYDQLKNTMNRPGIAGDSFT